MSNRSSIIPASHKMTDENAKCDMKWLLFFQTLLNGDVGTAFSPEFVGLASTGTPTITGVYYQNAGFIDFYVRITPVTDTSSTAGTTYFVLPFQPTSDCVAFTTTEYNSALGAIQASTRRVYPPSWDNITTPITISGRVPLQQ